MELPRGLPRSPVWSNGDGMTKTIAGLLAAFLAGTGTLLAQSPSDAETLRLLRQTIEDQKRNPDKVIHNYTSTNLPPAEKTNATPAREPASKAAAKSKPVAAVAESKAASPAAMSAGDKKAAAAELERQFLNG